VFGAPYYRPRIVVELAIVQAVVFTLLFGSFYRCGAYFFIPHPHPAALSAAACTSWSSNVWTIHAWNFYGHGARFYTPRPSPALLPVAACTSRSSCRVGFLCMDLPQHGALGCMQEGVHGEEGASAVRRAS